MSDTIDTDADIKKIHDAWDEEGSIGRLGMRPGADKRIQAALVPPGGDWQCVAPEGAIMRSIVWHEMEVALVNPRGDMLDHLEGEIAMGLCATPIMDRALRVISILANDPDNSDLIRRIARAAVDYVERRAPDIQEPEDEEDDDPEARVNPGDYDGS
jgi:hypothetical protein